MREAVSVIAEMRDSDRLRKFLETGSDRTSFLSPPCSKGKTDIDWVLAGETVPATRQDWPRGLNQLGNTCYLNSLLQVCISHMRRLLRLTRLSISILSRTFEMPLRPC